MSIILKNWSLGFRSGPNPYDPPESGGNPVLHGLVFGHPKHANGNFVGTSPLVSYDPATDEFITRHNRYKLEEVDPEYEKRFPDAKARLIANLRKGSQ
jgi:hypothetical protein